MRNTIVFSLVLLYFTVGSIRAQEESWTLFRGTDRNNHSKSTGLLKEWPEGGPKLLWKAEGLGEGYSNLSFYGNKIYTMGDFGPDCCVIALEKDGGKKIWSTAIGDSGDVGRYKGPRSTPAVDGKNVFAYSQFGDFACVDAENGELKWCGNVVNELGGRYLANWGFASSPIFYGENVIIPIGGNDGTLIAFTKDGKRPWRSKDLKDGAPYSTPIEVEIEGVKQFVMLSNVGAVGIDADTGKLLWTGPRKGDRAESAVCSDPVYKDGIVFVSSSYGIGAHGFKITKEDNEFKAEEIYASKQLPNHHGGIVLVDDYAYFTTDRELICLDIRNGEVKWRNRCVGKGSLTYAEGNLIVRAEAGDGAIALVKATPDAYQEFSRFNQPNRSNKQSWTYPIVFEGKLYIRDQDILLCYDLKAE